FGGNGGCRILGARPRRRAPELTCASRFPSFVRQRARDAGLVAAQSSQRKRGMKPTARPANPCFSSGPCAKRPGWSPAVLSAALVGRSHRATAGLKQLVEVIERSRAV